jgi:hypothetical protein
MNDRKSQYCGVASSDVMFKFQENSATVLKIISTDTQMNVQVDEHIQSQSNKTTSKLSL